MNLGYLNSFYQVAKYGSFTQGAEALRLSKGVLSRHVKHLEHELSAQLFLRTTRSVVLTESGQALFEKCFQIFKLADEVQQHVLDITQEDIGGLRFSCSTSLGEQLFPKIIKTYRELMPSVELELTLKNEMVDILHGDFDIALRTTDILEDDIVAKYLGQIKDVVVASPALLAEIGEISEPHHLYEKPCLLNNHQSRWNKWSFTHEKSGSSTIEVSGLLSVNHYTQQRKCALEGMGVAKLPFYLVEYDLKSGKLKEVLHEYNSGTHHLYIVHAKHSHLPRKIKVFKKLLWDWSRKNSQFFC